MNVKKHLADTFLDIFHTYKICLLNRLISIEMSFKLIKKR